MKKGITLSKENAIAIIRWYESKSENWGSWGNYPTLPVGASYLQYEDCECIIKLDCRVSLADGENENFKYITSGSGRNTPGVKEADDYISFYSLKNWCLPEEAKAAEELRRAAHLSAYNEAKSNFEKLPTNMQSDLLAITITACGSNNSRKKAIAAYAFENKEIIQPIMGELKDVRKIVDCLQNNHTYYM